jgi:hypothetical protein
MAEYNLQTGRTTWQRVVQALQREKVEKWLTQAYPTTAQAKPVSTGQTAKKTRK